MNVLAHRIAGGAPVRRLHLPPLPSVRVVPAVHVPRSVLVLTASLAATTGAMLILQRVTERIG